MDPVIVSFLLIQVSEKQELDELRKELNIENRSWLIVPITNSDSFQNRSTHWSLLLVNVSKQRFFHFDSCGNINKQASLAIAAKIVDLCCFEATTSISVDQVVEFPQQENGSDCGVYLLLGAKILCENLNILLDDNIPSLVGLFNAKITPSEALACRRNVKKDILALAADASK
jgi:Ulp1 family protease